MGNLIFNRTVSVFRGVETNDPTNGARMVATAIITAMSCTIQPGRVRHLGSSADPAGVASASTDDMSAWKMQCAPPVRILRNDTIVDDIGRDFIVSTVYETAYGSDLTMRPVAP